MNKIISSEAAAELVNDGWTITTGGFGSCGHPEALTTALASRYTKTGSPKNITLIFAAGQGDKTSRGLNRIACEGLIKRVIGGYWALTPKLGELAKSNKIEAYNWPQGVISHFFRSVAGAKPGVISPIGLHTFIDPRMDGGKLNAACTEDLVELISLKGKEYLFYPSFPIHFAMLRGTRADTDGNITLEDEANFQDVLTQAQAVRNSGGIVVFQVLEIVEPGTLDAHAIRVPGIFVDYLVKANPEDHWQTYGEKNNPAYTGRGPKERAIDDKIPLTAKKIIARRALLEIGDDHPVINLGIGTPEYVAAVAEEDNKNRFTLTVESGAIGGTPAGGLSFGASKNPRSFVDQSYQFDFYDGGGLDMAFLGCGQVDSQGNVNVSRFANKLNGVGGFVNISQTTKKLFFCGSFTADGLDIRVSNGKVVIRREGKTKKFVRTVDHLSYNAKYGSSNGQVVKFITERAVIELREGKLVLTEIAPGLDIEKDVLNQSTAEIGIAGNVKTMDACIFRT